MNTAVNTAVNTNRLLGMILLGLTVGLTVVLAPGRSDAGTVECTREYRYGEGYVTVCRDTSPGYNPPNPYRPQPPRETVCFWEDRYGVGRVWVCEER